MGLGSANTAMVGFSEERNHIGNGDQRSTPSDGGVRRRGPDVKEAATAKFPGIRPDDLVNNRIFFRIFQLGNTLQRRSVSELGITTVQWAVLGALSHPQAVQDGMLVGELADYLIVSRQNLDGVLKRLERYGYVERVTDPGDRRARQVRMTEAGVTFWTDLQIPIYHFYDQATADFSFDERIAVAHYLNTLQKKLDTVKL